LEIHGRPDTQPATDLSVSSLDHFADLLESRTEKQGPLRNDFPWMVFENLQKSRLLALSLLEA
jgi:hypothetical protein